MRCNKNSADLLVHFFDLGVYICNSKTRSRFFSFSVRKRKNSIWSREHLSCQSVETVVTTVGAWGLPSPDTKSTARNGVKITSQTQSRVSSAVGFLRSSAAQTNFTNCSIFKIRCPPFFRSWPQMLSYKHEVAFVAWRAGFCVMEVFGMLLESLLPGVETNSSQSYIVRPSWVMTSCTSQHVSSQDAAWLQLERLEFYGKSLAIFEGEISLPIRKKLYFFCKTLTALDAAICSQTGSKR